MPKSGDHLFVCVSQYLRSRNVLAEYLPEHLEWLRKQDAAGRIVASGAQEPPIGGVMIVAAKDMEALRELLATDPFQIRGCAAYHVHEFKLNSLPDRGRLMDYFFSERFDVESTR